MCLVSPVVISTNKTNAAFREIARLIARSSLSHPLNMKAQPSIIFRSLTRACNSRIVYMLYDDELYMLKSNKIYVMLCYVFFLRVRCSYKHKCGRYRNAFNRREVIMHAQPSSGSMHLIFGPYVRPIGACLSRVLHIVDNFICLC